MKKTIFMVFIFIVHLYANPSPTIDEQITIIKNAPEAQRIELMNQFKRQLILMNQTQREEAIIQLKNTQTTNSMPPPTSLLPASQDIINTLQESSIEQQVQITQEIHIQETVQEINSPSIERQPIPTSQPSDTPMDIEPNTPTLPPTNIPSNENPASQAQPISTPSSQPQQGGEPTPLPTSSETPNTNIPTEEIQPTQIPSSSTPSTQPTPEEHNGEIPIQGGNF